VLAEHAAIVEGIRHGQPEQAAAAVAQHLARTLVALRLPIAAGWGSVATERSPAVAAQ
jgi:DNA-binding FadR family transcriptional regulator